MARIYNLNRDAPDERDLVRYESTIKAFLPKSCFHDKLESQIFNQGSLGSCTAQSTMAMAFEHLGFLGSRLFQYYNARMMDGNINQDAGSTLRQSLKVLNKFGTVDEQRYGYIERLWKQIPPKSLYDEASLLSSKFEYKRVIQTEQQLKICIANGNPFVFGFSIYENFDTWDFSKKPIMPIPIGKQIGGHAVCCVGYDDAKQCFIIRNSWGKSWGHNGYFYMPYSFIENTEYCFDFWTITNIINEKSDADNNQGNKPVNCVLADIFKRFTDRISNLLHH
jgi:C1A family cysteine protease